MSQRRPRMVDEGYLAWLRKRHCTVCGKPPPCDPAHIRTAYVTLGKRYTGMSEKPDDRWALSLCRSCHDKQHSQNEMEFWMGRGINPFEEAVRLYREYGGTGGKPRRKRTTIKPRLPKEERRKIRGRKFQRRVKCKKSRAATSTASASKTER